MLKILIGKYLHDDNELKATHISLINQMKFLIIPNNLPSLSLSGTRTQ